jgi:hypothetical protein
MLCSCFCNWQEKRLGRSRRRAGLGFDGSRVRRSGVSTTASNAVKAVAGISHHVVGEGKIYGWNELERLDNANDEAWIMFVRIKQ